MQVARLFFWSLEFSFFWSILARQRYFRRMIGFTVLGDSMKTVMTPLSDEGGKRLPTAPGWIPDERHGGLDRMDGLFR